MYPVVELMSAPAPSRQASSSLSKLEAPPPRRSVVRTPTSELSPAKHELSLQQRLALRREEFSPNPKVTEMAKALTKEKWIIDPRTSQLMPYWDMVMLMSLLFTMLISPYEVAFVSSINTSGALFITNRLVDAAFTIDIFLSFYMMYQLPESEGARWVFNPQMIRSAYLRGWFAIDLLSVLPFWIFQVESSDDLSSLTTIKLVKLLRMIKLTRVFKASRILKRRLMETLVGYLELTYAVLKMIQLLGLLVLWSHWQACLWGLSAELMTSNTWVTTFRANELATNGNSNPEAWEVYVAALYWSVMTVTGIGCRRCGVRTSDFHGLRVIR